MPPIKATRTALACAFSMNAQKVLRHLQEQFHLTNMHLLMEVYIAVIVLVPIT